MEQRVRIFGVSPPAVPHANFGESDEGGVGGYALWSKYYESYDRYTSSIDRWPGLFLSATPGNVGFGLLGDTCAQDKLGCGGDVVVSNAADCISADNGQEISGEVDRRSIVLRLLSGDGIRDRDVAGRGGSDGVAEGHVFKHELSRAGGTESTISQGNGMDVKRFQSISGVQSGVFVAGDGSCGITGTDDTIVKPKLGDGDVPSGLGVNTVRNRIWRAQRKERKQRKQQVQRCDDSVPEWRRKSVNKTDFSANHRSFGSGYFTELDAEKRSRLRESRAERLEAENKLCVAKAERALLLLQSSDLEKEKKMRETRVMRETELNKVKVEQAFSKLAASGNVSGFAETVVSGTPTLASGSISPNSSVSAAEVHAMQKELLELQRRDKKMSEQYKKIDPVGFARILKQCEGTVDTSFTADTDGHEIAQYGGYHLGEDGRYHSGENFDYY